MPISFPFMKQHVLGAFPEMVVGQTDGGIEKADPLPWMRHEKTPPLKPLAPATGGLAAMAVQQSVSGPLAPPARRLAGPAIAASLALATQTPPAMPPPVERPQPASPAANHFQAMQGLQSRDLAQLRVELEAEIEQVRHDLFGAAMGVSTLKDRLDEMEAAPEKVQAAPPPAPAELPPEEISRQVQAWLAANLASVVEQAVQTRLEQVPEKAAPPPAPFEVSPEEISQQVQTWLTTNLPSAVEQAVQRSLDQAMQHTLATLSSSEFFRLPVCNPGLMHEMTLSQAPQILSTSQS